jgi:integrase
MESNQGNSKNTNRVYKASYELFIQSTNLTEIEIKAMDIKQLSNKIESVFMSNTKYSVNSKLTRISSAKNYISEYLNIDFPKSRNLKKLSKSKARRSNKIDITVTHIKKIVKVFETEYKNANGYKPQKLRNLILIKLLAFTGQRIGDILSMTIKQAKSTKLFYKQAKTGAEVTIENPCIPEILAYINIVGLTDDQPLFSTGLNKTCSYTYANMLVKQAGLKIGIDKLSCHVFRKYTVTHLKELGLSDREVMSITGHSDNRMIGYYTGDSKQVENLQGLLLSEV